jgi:hypothetical protein
MSTTLCENTIIANRLGVFPEFHSDIPVGVHYSFKLFLDTLPFQHRQEFSFHEVMQFMEIAFEPEMTRNPGFADLHAAIVTGEEVCENVVFFSIDSNVWCKHDMFRELNPALKLMNLNKQTVEHGQDVDMEDKGYTFVYVETPVAKTEAMYKLANPARYEREGVNLDFVRQYIKISDMTDSWLKVNFPLLHSRVVIGEQQCVSVMYDAEQNIINNGDVYSPNNINDDVQLDIMSKLMEKFPGSQSYLFTNDKALQVKCSDAGVKFQI